MAWAVSFLTRRLIGPWNWSSAGWAGQSQAEGYFIDEFTVKLFTLACNDERFDLYGLLLLPAMLRWVSYVYFYTLFGFINPYKESNSWGVSGYMHLKLPIYLPKGCTKLQTCQIFYESTHYFTHLRTEQAIQLFCLDLSVTWKWHLRLGIIATYFLMSKVGYLFIVGKVIL